MHNSRNVPHSCCRRTAWRQVGPRGMGEKGEWKIGGREREGTQGGGSTSTTETEAPVSIYTNVFCVASGLQGVYEE
ncbi:hypothetical protein E2C01_094888 [Portunus trituberculatus]|uniref:Uncharacterized protein n=1 Tax=Portunus trituberculatus TaxID=210409 RepID=A0A5B7JYE2_PORTR|nr:hypothetical protein [Portunus trituberculatus]